MEEFAPREVQAVQDYLRIKIDVAKADGPVWNNFKSPQESFSIRMHWQMKNCFPGLAHYSRTETTPYCVREKWDLLDITIPSSLWGWQGVNKQPATRDLNTSRSVYFSSYTAMYLVLWPHYNLAFTFLSVCWWKWRWLMEEWKGTDPGAEIVEEEMIGETGARAGSSLRLQRSSWWQWKKLGTGRNLPS